MDGGIPPETGHRCAYSPEQRRALNDYTNIRGWKPRTQDTQAAQRAVPESNSGAMNEAWAAEYRLKQNTATLTRRNSGEH